MPAERSKVTRRAAMVDLARGAAAAALLGCGGATPTATDPSAGARRPSSRIVNMDAKPGPFLLDTSKTAVIVVDMQNDFGAKGGMFDRAGIDIRAIQDVVRPARNVLAAARQHEMKVIYLKMAFRPDLSDLGAPDSANHLRHARLKVGDKVRAPDGSESRILIRDTWNTDVLPELTPQRDDVVVYKHRFSGFFQTNLDAILEKIGATHLVVVGCTTSVCVESTVRDAMFRDYSCLLLTDCMAEPIGFGMPRSNHDASLLSVQVLLGWVARSDALLQALPA